MLICVWNDPQVYKHGEKMQTNSFRWWRDHQRAIEGDAIRRLEFEIPTALQMMCRFIWRSNVCCSSHLHSEWTERGHHWRKWRSCFPWHWQLDTLFRMFDASFPNGLLVYLDEILICFFIWISMLSILNTWQRSLVAVNAIYGQQLFCSTEPWISLLLRNRK